MNIHDPALFSIVVPTYEGTRFLRRLLDYFRTQNYEGSIVLSDNSSGEHRDFVSRCPQLYPDLDLEVRSYPEDVRFLDKLVDTLSAIESRFVMLHAHDDFMVPRSAEDCVSFLANNPDYCVARGRIAMIALSRGGEGGIEASLVPHPMRGYETDDPIERMLDHVQRYAATFYSVHERRELIDSFVVTEQATKNVIFFQYLSSCIAAYRGKIWCSDSLFYVRQGHAGSWSGALRRGNYEHWPMLITSPHFSRYYQEFRAALCGLVQVDDKEAFGARLDEAATALLARGFCGHESDNPGEARFLDRLRDPASAEHATIGAITKFIAAYPDTM